MKFKKEEINKFNSVTKKWIMEVKNDKFMAIRKSQNKWFSGILIVAVVLLVILFLFFGYFHTQMNKDTAITLPLSANQVVSLERKLLSVYLIFIDFLLAWRIWVCADVLS